MVTVVVPYRGGCPHRQRAWDWVLTQYEHAHPGWRVVRSSVAPEDPWCKATAVTPAVEAAPDGVVIVADADCWTEGLAQAVTAVESGLTKWAIPHLTVKRLSHESSYGLMSGAFNPEFDQAPYWGLEGGGFIVAHRDTLLDCPLDPRFVGWGQEDLSWGVALTALHGRAWRGEADLIHLWHPPQPRMNRKVGTSEGMALQRRYLAARRDPAEMRALIEEARCLPIC